MSNHINELKVKLKQYNQEHLLLFLDRLPTMEKNKLSEQLGSIDYEQLMTVLHNKDVENVQQQNITQIHHEDWDNYNKDEQAAFTNKGMELLQKGEVAVVVVAGGQGSRLGHAGPKGTLDIGLPSGKSLFQLQAERLRKLSAQAGKFIPWYIMTSPENHEDTIAFFEAAHYFGYPREDCFFFQQNTMPALDHEGRLILSEDASLKLAPSGHGDCFASLKKSGALTDMKQRGVNWLFYCNVDNALIKIADPAFIGVAATKDYPIATKVIEKMDPYEKIGILCQNNGRPTVLEYNEIPDQLLRDREPSGKLLYHLGNISIHLFKVDFIEEHADADIPFHVASKIMDYMDAEGNVISPDEPNAYKLERFIFDFFPLTAEMTVLKGKREEEFAPVKNKEGVDSPASARELVLRLHEKWLHEAGVPIEKLGSGDFEISPLLSYGGEDLDNCSLADLLRKS